MSVSDWNQVPFEAILADSKDGEWGIGEEAGSHTACWMVRGTDFTGINDPVTDLPLRWIRDHLMERKKLQAGDIVFEMAGGTAKQSTGRSALIRKSFFKSRTEHPVLCASFCRHLRLKKEFEPAFVFYLLQTLYLAGYMGVFNTQHTGVSRFQYTAFKKKTVLSVPLPEIQKKIAAILTAYDDLIENNQRQITALEKMAEELYREWFVRLRFPGHEQASVEKRVPTGWAILPFSQVASINPGERLPRDEEIPYVGMDRLSTSSMYFVSEELRKNGAGSKFRNRDVLVPRITPCLENGKRGFTMTLGEGQIAVGSTEFIVVRERLFSAEHLYLLTCSNAFRQHAELSMTGASGRQRVQEDCFDFFWIPVPPENIRIRFTSAVRPMFEQVKLLATLNHQLRQTRDLLLPRLISGKLRVDDLDIQFPPGMRED